MAKIEIVIDFECLIDHINIINEHGTQEEIKQVIEYLKKHRIELIDDNGNKYAYVPQIMHEIADKYKKDRSKNED